jgi:hypothetical protein
MPSPWLCGNLAGIERTLFTLDWLLDKDLRQRMNAAWSKENLHDPQPEHSSRLRKCLLAVF